jgi:hypothetical protein
MSDLQLLVAQLVKLGLLALLMGMALRGRLGLCWSFGAYVIAILAGNTLVTLAPERFYTPAFWVLKQGVYDVLKMAVAIELALRSFAAFRGALRSARAVLVVLLGASTLWLGWLTPRSSYHTLWEWQPGVVTATVWLLAATALMVVLYQVPIGEWQRAIMLGFAPYLLVFVTLINVLRRHGWELRAEVGLVDSLAYLGLVVFWARVAWRRDAPALVSAPAGAA